MKRTHAELDSDVESSTLSRGVKSVGWEPIERSFDLGANIRPEPEPMAIMYSESMEMEAVERIIDEGRKLLPNVSHDALFGNYSWFQNKNVSQHAFLRAAYYKLKIA